MVWSLRVVALVSLLLGLGGCQQILGVDDVQVSDGGIEKDADPVSTPRFLAGSISGLSQGEFVELSLNGATLLAVSQNGSFMFPGVMNDDDSYEVVVAFQPGGLRCQVENGLGTISGSNVIDVEVLCAPAARTVGGSVSGVSTGGMVELQLNAEAPVSVANGSFTFPSELVDADAYAVRLTAVPSNQSCVVTNATGVIDGADVSDVSVACESIRRTVGGSISGLGAGQEVQLTLNGSDTRVLSNNGSFQFLGTSLVEGDSYSVVLASQSAPLACELTGESGTVAGANIDSIIVDCSPDTLVVGGNASGISDGELVELKLNGSEVIAVSGNGAFVFTTPMVSGGTFAIELESVPDTLNCSLSGDTGTVGAVDVNDVQLSCTRATFAVGGVVSGLGIEQIELTLNGSQSIGVADDGAFAFPSAVASGDFYSVAITAIPLTLDCSITNGAGTVGTAAVDDVLVACAPSALLISLVPSVVSPLSPGFQPEISNYAMSVSLLAQELVLRPTSADPNATIFVGGVPVLSGQTAAPVPLALGTNLVTVQVIAQSGAVQNYLLDVERAGDLAQVAYGKAPNCDAGDLFGFAAAVSGDTLVVSSVNDASQAAGVNGNQNDNSRLNAGGVFVFRRSGNGWAQEAYLKASNPDVGDQFGVSVTIDGDTLVVGANLEDGGSGGVNGNPLDNGVAESGAAYVFTRSGTTWSQQAYLKAALPRPQDQFGGNVDLQGDVLAISAHTHDSGATGINGDETDDGAPNSGAVYIFRRTGATWEQEAFLKASNAEADDNFGASLAFSGDTLVASAPTEASNATGVNGDQANNNALQSGAVYVFRRTGTTWSQEAFIKASNTGSGDSFAVVALSGDTMIVGATGEDSAATGVDGDQQNNNIGNPGAAYIFHRTGTTWSQQAYLKASNTEPFDGFGNNVAVHGGIAVVAATTEDSAAAGINGNDANNGATDSGAVYLYRRTGDTWSLHAYIKASNVGSEDNFGVEKGFVLTGETLIIASPVEDSNAIGFGGDQSDNSVENSGAIYIFQ